MIDINNESDAAYREQVKQNYDFYEWAGRTKEGQGDVRLTDFHLDELEGWSLTQQEDLTPSVRQTRVVRYVFSAADNQRLVSTVFTCDSVIEAHESLIDVVMTYMAPKLPRCETKGLPIGDICFAGHGDLNVAVIFARFNILTEIQNTGPHLTSVDEFARGIDSMIFGRYKRT